MATFPTLIPSASQVAPGAWPVSAISSLNGTEAHIRQGSAEIGRRLQLTFVNVTESDFLAILSHYRGQRSGFDPFGFDTATLAADLTPVGYAWLYASRPQVVDEHANVFTVSCEFRSEPRGLVTALGKAWQSAQTSLTRNVAPGVQWVNSQSTFLPGTGARFADGARWATASTVFEPQSNNMGKTWITDSTIFLPGNGPRFAPGAQWVTVATVYTPPGVNMGKSWTTSATTLTLGTRTITGGTPYTFTGGSTKTFTNLTGWLFTVSSSKVITEVGFYDHQQNGLSGSYEIYLEELVNPANIGAGSSTIAFTANGQTDYVAISNSSTLSGVWRTANLPTTGATLTSGRTYLLMAALTSGTADQMVKNATSVTLAANVNYVQNFDFYATGSTTAADGIGYFGPMIFFQ
jgi:hypothetical protein